MEYLPAIISAIGTIVAAWFAYNQYSKNKLTDLKIEQYKQSEEKKSKRRADNCSLVYGELWNVLHELDADRVYIVQPHPLGNEIMLSVYFEVNRKGVEGMKQHIYVYNEYRQAGGGQIRKGHIFKLRLRSCYR